MGPEEGHDLDLPKQVAAALAVGFCRLRVRVPELTGVAEVFFFFFLFVMSHFF